MQSPSCRWPAGDPCREFSTDGTRLGAHIAHTMGTANEAEIARMWKSGFESDVDAEQADWDSDEE